MSKQWLGFRPSKEWEKSAYNILWQIKVDIGSERLLFIDNMSTSRPSAVLHDLLNCLVFLLEVADCVLLPAFYIDRATLQIESIHVMLAMSSIFKADCCILGFLDST